MNSLPYVNDYIQEKEAKVHTETARTEARAALEEYRVSVFPGLQNEVNKYLQKFNAGFHIDSLAPENIGGGSGSTCTYNVVINNTPVAVRSAKVPQGDPSFRNSLSAGDRNTLALALFFSSLDQNANLADTIVVIDDPVSSLDDHRSLTTVQAVRDFCPNGLDRLLCCRTANVFFVTVWSGAYSKECLSLEIGQSGDKSTIRCWDVNQDAITEHDQRHKLLQGYAANQAGNKMEVAAAIRLHLEGFLRVACAGSFPPGSLLGPFLRDCRDRVGRQDEVLNEIVIQELADIVEYGNQFHHDTNQALQTQEINSRELLGFVQCTLAFVGPPRA